MLWRTADEHQAERRPSGAAGRCSTAVRALASDAYAVFALPHSLWARAVKMAATYGLHRTARTLRLDYYTLRKHVTEVAHAEPSEKGAAATFLELSPPAPSASCECTLELEDASGAKMRVQVKGMVMPDLTAISQSFWNQRP